MAEEYPPFICPDCKTEYTMAEADQSGSFCTEESCADNMTMLLKVESEEPEEVLEDGEDAPKEKVVEPSGRKEIGLGILVCDVSGSMEDFAYAGRRVSKLSMVAGSVARGIWDLVEQMEENARKNAYVALIYFAKEAIMGKDEDGQPFIKSIYDIGEFFDTARDFSDFLMMSMREAQRQIPGNPIKELVFGKNNSKHFTNITSGLELAHDIVNAGLFGNLTDFGGPENIKVIEDVCITPTGGYVTVPNIRCLIYSDGAHNHPKGSKVTNPFSGDDTSVLLATYFGSSKDKGGAQMQELAALCPKHGDASFFLIDDAEGYQKLRGLFRMSSGVSGFCPNCMPRDY